MLILYNNMDACDVCHFVLLIITDWKQSIYDYKRNVTCSAWTLVQEFREIPANL